MDGFAAASLRPESGDGDEGTATEIIENATRLRRRLRALAMGQREAFDMIFYHLGSNHPDAMVAYGAGRRLAQSIMLLGDVAWVHGEKHAHEASPLPLTSEVHDVRQHYRPHADTKRLYRMTPEQQAAVTTYLDLLILLLTGCIEFDVHAPSRTLARQSGSFRRDMIKLRSAFG